MKLSTVINYLGWASGLFGGLLMLAGVIDFFIGGGFLGVKYFYNFLLTSIPFILFGIFLLVATRECCCCCKEEGK